MLHRLRGLAALVLMAATVVHAAVPATSPDSAVATVTRAMVVEGIGQIDDLLVIANNTSNLPFAGSYGAVIPPENTHDVILVDVSQSRAPRVVSTIDLPEDAPDNPQFGWIAVSVLIDPERRLAFIEAFSYAGERVVEVFDISQPEAPVRLGRSPLAKKPSGRLRAREGNLLFGSSFFGMDVSDASDPLHPVEVGHFDLPWHSTIESIEVRGTLAFLLVQESRLPPNSSSYLELTRLLVVDVSDPQRPVMRGSWEDPEAHYPTDLAIEGGRAYVLEMAALQILDVSDPDHLVALGRMKQLGNITQLQTFWAIALRGPNAFVAHSTLGLRVFDISDPLHPLDLGALAMPYKREPKPWLRDVRVGAGWAVMVAPEYDLFMGALHVVSVDLDGDGALALTDVCPGVPDPLQANADGDRLGDACDSCPFVRDVGKDGDFDGIDEACDNCIFVPNGPLLPDSGGFSQRDTDGDGYGNACDPDFNGDGVVNFADLATMKGSFFQTGADLVTDLNGDGVVNFGDLAILKKAFSKPPGPAARKR